MESSDNKQTYSYSSEENGVRKSIDIRQVENGWIVCVESTSNQPNMLGQPEYKHSRKEYISSTDPREMIKKNENMEKEKTSIVGSVNSLMEELAGMQGMLIVP